MFMQQRTWGCKCLALFLIVSTIWSGYPIAVQAQEPAEDGYSQEKVNTCEDNEYANDTIIKKDGMVINNGRLTKYSGKRKTIIIPDSVTSIDPWVFAKNKYIQKVVIPDTVTELPEYLFFSCKNLKTVKCSKNIVHVGESCFGNTSWLKEQRKKHALVIVGKCVVDGKNAKGKVQIPDNITEISAYAFWSNEKITSVRIPDSVTTIQDYAFKCCEKLKTIHFGKGVKEFGSDVFEYTLWYSKAHDKNGCIIINNILLSGSKAKGKLVIPSKVKVIAEGAFYENSKITEVIIPETITSIDSNTFHDCINLKKVELPKALISIGDYAFCGCKKLKITIPDTVRYISTSEMEMESFFGKKTYHQAFRSVKHITYHGDVYGAPWGAKSMN